MKTLVTAVLLATTASTAAMANISYKEFSRVTNIEEACGSASYAEGIYGDAMDEAFDNETFFGILSEIDIAGYCDAPVVISGKADIDLLTGDPIVFALWNEKKQRWYFKTIVQVGTSQWAITYLKTADSNYGITQEDRFGYFGSFEEAEAELFDRGYALY